MILNARKNSFILFFPKGFFSPEIDEQFSHYYKNLLLPFESISDFMSSTIQQVDFPGWEMNLAEQVGPRGKHREYKSSQPIADLFKREFTITFKLTDAFLNYFIFLNNALCFLDFENKERSLEPIRLILLNNEGYMVSSVVFNKPILFGMDGIDLSQSSVTPDFNTFSAKFKYFDFKLETDFD